MKTIFANTPEELYQAIEDTADIAGSVEIILKRDTVYELKEPVRIVRDNVSLKGKNTVFKGSKRVFLDQGDGIINIRLGECGIAEMKDFSQGPFADFWHEYAIPKPYMDECGMGTMLFYEDKLLPLSRYPKKGFMKVRSFTDQEKAEFVPADKRIFSWDGYENLLLVGYWQWEWANQRCRVKSVDDDKKTISLNEPYHCFGYKDGAHYYALNVKDEISSRGEWVKDVKSNTVTLYPRKKQAYVDITVAGNGIEAQGVENFYIQGITIQEYEKNGIKITDSKNVKIDECVIKNTGGWGIIADHCENVSIQRTSVQDTGGGGIAISGGDRKRLIPSGNLIKGCTISRVAGWHRTYTAAIQVCGVGGRVSGCKICDVPHFAIVYHGNNHMIENNEISGACYEANDAGAIYSGADWTCRGNIIRRNYFHDMNGFQNKGCYGIYFDDYVSSAEVYDNLFVNVHQGVLIGGGRDYKIYGNFFYGGVSAVLIDDRTNVRNDAVMNKLFQKAKMLDYKSDIWRKAYPELYDIENQNYGCEANNQIFQNKAVNCDESKNFVYLKHGERFEFETEAEFCRMCNGSECMQHTGEEQA